MSVVGDRCNASARVSKQSCKSCVHVVLLWLVLLREQQDTRVSVAVRKGDRCTDSYTAQIFVIRLPAHMR